MQRLIRLYDGLVSALAPGSEQARPVELFDAKASFSQEAWTVGNVIDGRPDEPFWKLDQPTDVAGHEVDQENLLG